MADSHTQQRSFLGRLWHGFWGGLDWLRRIVVNILFLLLLAIVIRLIFFGEDALVIADNSVLVLAPEGLVVEQYSGSPLDQALAEATQGQRMETRLRDLVDAVRLARDDDQISHLVIHPDRMLGIGLASMQELETVIADFKTSGKPVIAVSEFMAQHQYYLASLADEIWMDPDGVVWIDGYARYRNYYSEALDKLAVNVNLFRVGEFKSAMEPYIRQNMSPAAKQANLYWLGGQWEQFLASVSSLRGLRPDQLAQLPDRTPELMAAADGDAGRIAMAQGLVDRLLTRPEVRSELIQRTGRDPETGSFQQVDIWNYLGLRRGPKLGLGGDRVAIVVAEGEILDGTQPPGTVGGDSTARLIRDAVADDNTKAIVLRVDSPGGSGFASEIIRQELLAAGDAGKPVVVSMGDVAASGGYWIAMGGDEVWANPGTITGSIGIFGFIPTIPDSLAKLGISTDGVGTTELAGSLRIDRPLSEGVKTIVQNLIENGYQRFLNIVAQGRDLSVAEVDEIAQGRVWNGAQAEDRRLVDRLGGLGDAVDSAARMAGLEENYTVHYQEPELTAFEQFLVDLTATSASYLDLEFTSPVADLAWLQQTELVQDMRIFSQPRRGYGMVAHCFCTLD